MHHCTKLYGMVSARLSKVPGPLDDKEVGGKAFRILWIWRMCACNGRGNVHRTAPPSRDACACAERPAALELVGSEALKAVPVGSPPAEDEGAARECPVCLNEVRSPPPAAAACQTLAFRGSAPSHGAHACDEAGLASEVALPFAAGLRREPLVFQ